MVALVVKGGSRQPLTILGLNFGGLNNTSTRVANVSVGALNCPIIYNNHTSLACTVPAGTGAVLHAHLVMGVSCVTCVLFVAGGREECFHRGLRGWSDGVWCIFIWLLPSHHHESDRLRGRRDERHHS